MERLTDVCWRNFDPWECCGQDHFCHRGCHDLGCCAAGCIVPKLYARLAAYEDTGLEPGDVTDLMAAHGMAIEKLAECRMRAKKKAPMCYSPDTDRPYSTDTDVGCRHMVCDGDDEPIDRCKRCPLCYGDKQRHQPEPNAPLTIEELREMDLFEWLWIEVIHPNERQEFHKIESAYYQVYEDYSAGEALCCGWPGLIHEFEYMDYGKTWLAYRRKPEESAP